MAEKSIYCLKERYIRLRGTNFSHTNCWTLQTLSNSFLLKCLLLFINICFCRFDALTKKLNLEKVVEKRFNNLYIVCVFAIQSIEFELCLNFHF